MLESEHNVCTPFNLLFISFTYTRSSTTSGTHHGHQHLLHIDHSQWISSSGCSIFESSIDLLDFRGNLLGTLMLYGGIGQQFFVNVSNSTSPPMAVYATFPTDSNFTIIVQYSYEMLQLASVSRGWPLITTTFAYAIPPWGLQIYGLRTGSSVSLTSSSWTLNGCGSSTMLDIEPYIPSPTSIPKLPCLERLQPMPVLSIPFSMGIIAYATVYPSMSAMCKLVVAFDIDISGIYVDTVFVEEDELDGNQTIYWNGQPVYNAFPFVSKYQSTVLWLGINIAGRLFIGTGDSLEPLVSVAPLDPYIPLDSNSILYARTYTADATVSTINWVPLLQPCTPNSMSSFSNIGQGITFNYIFTNNHSSSLCNSDVSGVLLQGFGGGGGGYNSNLWISFPSPTNAIIYLQQPYEPLTLWNTLTCTWSIPLGSQSYVTYGCIDRGCSSIYIVIGVYMTLNTTIIYVPLCNVTIPGAELGEFIWNVLGSSTSNLQIIPYPPPPTYPPTVTITTSGRGSNSSDSNETSGWIGVIAALIAIIIIVGCIAWYKRWSSNLGLVNEQQPILS